MNLSLQSRISDLITAIGTDIKQHRTWITGSASGDLTGLDTTVKTDLVSAVNELHGEIGAGAPDASETVKGIAELATLAEVATGTDTSRIVTPAGVRQEVGDRTTLATTVKTSLVAAVNEIHGELGTGVPDASETVKGIAEIATLAEVAAGTDSTRIVTAAGVRQERTALKEEILGAGVPAALDTLDELAAALGDDANFASTVTTALSNKQPLDADLTAIAALASAANKVPYATGSGTWALADLTAAGRALIDDADAAAQRTTLSVYSSSEVDTALAGKQASDTDLTAIAALTSAADKVPYATGAGTWALATLTAAGRNLIDDVDTAGQRSTLSVYSQTELGNPDTDLAALYTTAKS